MFGILCNFLNIKIYLSADFALTKLQDIRIGLKKNAPLKSAFLKILKKKFVILFSSSDISQNRISCGSVCPKFQQRYCLQ